MDGGTADTVSDSTSPPRAGAIFVTPQASLLDGWMTASGSLYTQVQKAFN